jgi:pectin methylesterase-like acyl-CoA thioesterase
MKDVEQLLRSASTAAPSEDLDRRVAATLRTRPRTSPAASLGWRALACAVSFAVGFAAARMGGGRGAADAARTVFVAQLAGDDARALQAIVAPAAHASPPAGVFEGSFVGPEEANGERSGT